MRAQKTNPDYWQEFEFLVSDSTGDGTPDVELRRDKAGKYHLIWKARPDYWDREITPKQAAEFCLKRFVPDELHSHFTIA